MKISFKLHAAITDPEKMVLPGIVYVRRTLEDFTGFNIAIGWWHWGAHITVVWPVKT